MEYQIQDNKSQKKPKACRKKHENLKESESKFYSIKLEAENQPSLVQIAEEEMEQIKGKLPLSPEMLSQYEQNIYCESISVSQAPCELGEKPQALQLIMSKKDIVILFPNHAEDVENLLPNNGFAKVFLIQDKVFLSKVASVNILNKYYLFKVVQEEEGLFGAMVQLQEKVDHRIIGKSQDLYFQNELAPGSWFFSKYGARIYHGLIDLIRQQYKVRGYDEVISPNLFDSRMFKISGHYQNYKDNMFMLKCDSHGMCMKPMNCPGQYMIFKSKIRSYRDLPIRMAEFGVLHRNELSGALSGMSRCRRFVVDDCHIFCAESQLQSEILANLDFVKYVYSLFGLEYKLFLSSKPEKYLGSDELWEKAEGQLRVALDESGCDWEENPGDGAFYGPKIDIVLYDSMKKPHQCASIQVDFQAPIRFNMMYKSDEVVEKEDLGNAKEEKQEAGGKYCDFEPDEYDPEPFRWEEKPLKPGYERPVILHRAVLGSIERFISILAEHLNGKWPFWLSPRQVKVIPINSDFSEYAERVNKVLVLNNFHSEVDFSKESLNKKIKLAQKEQWNYMLVIGQKEIDGGGVNVRMRNGKSKGFIKVDNLIDELLQEAGANQRIRFSQE